MKKIILNVFLLTLALSYQIFAGYEGRFMRYPDIYKDKIVFTYEDDLWIANSAGGQATRLTTSAGTEYAAKFSPDGKWIAFTASYDGSSNVYLIPSTGGEPKRLTYNPGGVQTVAWTPDGEKIVYRSGFENSIGRDPRLYFVSKNGSAPERLPLDRGTLCSFNNDGSKMLYNRRGVEEYYWKRYKGGMYCDIWMYDFSKNEFTPISDYVGKNAYPMWIGNKMYFVSDRTTGVTNLYAQDLSTKKIDQFSNYDVIDVMWPETDGSQIVFIQDGYINVFNTANAKTTKIAVEINSDRWRLRPRTINPKEFVHHFSISDDGKTTALEARGDVFTIQNSDSKTLNLSNTSGTREMYPQLSPDGKWIAFFSDKSGEYQLYIQKAEGGEWIQLTDKLNKLVYHLLWSPDSGKILFGNKEYSIFYVDVKTKKLVKVDESNFLKNDEFYWEMSDYNWSPDSKWITYSFARLNRNNQIFLFSLEQNKKYEVTSDFYDNLNPSFDANGDYLYYLSSRNFNIQMDFYEDNHVVTTPYQVMAVQLRKGETPPFAESNGLEKKEKAKGFTIDIDGLKERTYPLPVDAGNYFYLKAGKGKVAWCSIDKFMEDDYENIFKPSGATKWSLHIYDIVSKTETVIDDKIANYEISTNGEQLISQKEKDYFVSNLDGVFQSKKLGKKVNLANMSYNVIPVNEWNQIFSDTWRWYRDFFYDKNMHGIDWKAIGEKYRSYIPQLSSRGDLNWVLSQLVGYLCVSHTYVGGGDFGVEPSVPQNNLFTGWLGADLIADKSSGLYKFEKIYGPSEYNLDLTTPLSRTDIEVKEGDYLLAINGNELKVPQDYFEMLQVTQNQKVTVTVNSKPTKEGAKTYTVQPIKNSTSPRYFRWLTDNINKVLKETDGKVGYMHINAMGSGGIGEFDKFFRAFRFKEGIIIDDRRNGGGWTEYFMIDKLERKVVAYNVLTGMEPMRYPGPISAGQFVLLANENTGSDGEAFIEHFKERKLGTVVGVPTWGGLVGIINAQRTIDNGSVNQSNNAFYNKDGKWLVENHGADPDVLIDNDPASVMAGKDAQLDKAIEVIKEKIKKNPFTFPPVPAYPVKLK
ncbi:MAG: PD40 domain-containing protein [Ignavibacteriales bacterium]|nr:PD40 domain-containing protein [Ignavibacteriales bacterium]